MDSLYNFWPSKGITLRRWRFGVRVSGWSSSLARRQSFFQKKGARQLRCCSYFLSFTYLAWYSTWVFVYNTVSIMPRLFITFKMTNYRCNLVNSYKLIIPQGSNNDLQFLLIKLNALRLYPISIYLIINQTYCKNWILSTRPISKNLLGSLSTNMESG